MSNCSLGIAFGSQRKESEDPIVSCYARVENIPKHVLKKVADKAYWNSTDSYLQHLDTLKLGPNVVPMIPHSMLRVEVMGLQGSVSRDPTPEELSKMEMLLDDAMQQGYVGFSTDALPYHFLSNDPNRDKRIPTQFAPFAELKSLTNIVRNYDRVWQATPPKDSPAKVLKTFLLTSGRLNKKPLKITAVAAMDIASNGKVVKMAKTLTWLLNSRLLKGRFYLQALSAPFKIWSDGPFNPLSEEISELRELIETDLEDRDARRAILSDPDYRQRFRKMWMTGKTGFNLARLKRKMRREDYAFNRTFSDMKIYRCPIKSWEGKTFQTVFDDYLAGQVPADKMEAKLISTEFADVKDEADFMLRELIMDPVFLPGFNDSGAHLTNMAFYDCNLRALKLAQQGGDKDVSFMVRRLTRDVSEFFNIASGTLNLGAQADIAIINPSALETYNGEDNVQRIYRDAFNHEQLVNRSDGVVSATIIAGKTVWDKDHFTETLNNEKFGHVLTAKPPLAHAAE